MAQHLCVKTGQIGVLVCNNLEIETSLQQQHENANESTQVFGDCPTQHIAFHDKFERTEQNSNCIICLQFPKHSSEMEGGSFLAEKFCKGGRDTHLMEKTAKL